MSKDKTEASPNEQGGLVPAQPLPESLRQGAPLIRAISHSPGTWQFPPPVLQSIRNWQETFACILRAENASQNTRKDSRNARALCAYPYLQGEGLRCTQIQSCRSSSSFRVFEYIELCMVKQQ